ncbi:MAG TPA: HD domain-containing protein [Limnochordia bacterium]
MYFLEKPHEELLADVLEKLSEADRAQLLEAFQVAHRSHEGKQRAAETRDEGRPNIDHPVRVMYSLFVEQGVRDIDVLRAALLHDVQEVSQTTTAELRQRFGEKVATWVERLTRRPGTSREAYARRIIEGPYEVFLIEIAARLDNLRTAYKRRKSLQPYFNETHRYYLLHAESLCDAHPKLRVYTEAMRSMMEGD